MPRHADQDDDDFLDEDPLPQDQDPDDVDDPDDDPDQNPCPFCGRPLHHGAAVCPGCGNFVDTDQRSARKPPWILLAAVLAIIAMLASIILALIGLI